MNNVYLYDGTFKSLLGLINILKVKPKDIKNIDNYIPNLFEEPIYLKIDKS